MDHATAQAFFRVALSPRRGSASQLRQGLRAFLAGQAAPAAFTEDIVLAAEEACINCIMHSGLIGDQKFEVSCEYRRDRIVLEIQDAGCGFDAAALDLSAEPSLENLHGRGLFIARAVMDTVEIDSSAARGGTRVRMEKVLT
jgi:anti-sigma regulatory factor (Ser/Thr protein kinase)